VDAEAEMENLFADDEAVEGGTQSLTQQEAEERAVGVANLDETKVGDTKKRVNRNPQPKLNPERLMGPRGIQTLEDLFSDWQPRGKGKEFDDLDLVMKRLEHWAHRLYPKLPFDGVLDVVANRLGKKKVVQTHVKKIRLGMVTEPVREQVVQQEEDEDEREVERYGEEESQTDLFGDLVRAGGGAVTGLVLPPSPVQPTRPAPALTAEQHERIRANKELAAQRRREREVRDRRLAEEEEEAARAEEESQLEQDEEIERELAGGDNRNNMQQLAAPAASEFPETGNRNDAESDSDSDSESKKLRIDSEPDKLNLDEMMDEMED